MRGLKCLQFLAMTPVEFTVCVPIEHDLYKV